MRKNITSLTSAEWTAVVNALNAMKSSGKYDAFTKRHVEAMMKLTLFPNESGTQRNVAHRGPAFLPWHRKAILEFEAALGLSLPYWNWESLGSSWKTSGVWSKVGGNGSSSKGYRITTGPFANWKSILYNNGSYVTRTGIIRRFESGSMTKVSVTNATYDASPWNENTSSSRSFRQTVENAHNNVHVLIGGDMTAGTSPNDPMFWFHHCNVDRIWMRWQQRNGFTAYAPTSGAPTGHNLNDTMTFLQSPTTVRSMLDARALGITYDTLG